MDTVALRKESVDRNRSSLDGRRQANVALRKESVDRNKKLAGKASALLKSLSARRAWIEISWMLRNNSGGKVALRKESVDRNALLGLYPHAT